MRTTHQQDEAFLRAVVSNSLLEDAIDWIRTNLSPEDVFDDKELREWAKANGYTEE